MIILYNTGMIELNIPGRSTIQIEHLVCDVNGTLAIDGQLHDGIKRSLSILRDRLRLHLLTADTHGQQEIIDQLLGIESVRVRKGNEAHQKESYVDNLGREGVVAVGQGANDALMLKAAEIGIGIFSAEGIATETLLASDIIMPDIFSALELFERPLRLVATLRK
ncbi:MAG: HAD family hydrolase [Anaerolineales bacterium]|nr:HAD family hydrolase [Chloroflexota bacterium]MBL6980280.1 HAD family hydrolase [Anaerolineales bacterium]